MARTRQTGRDFPKQPACCGAGVHRAPIALVTLLALSVYASPAHAQHAYGGFAVERLYLSSPGAGWFVMDALDMHGGLGGAFSLDVGYARRPLVLSDGTRTLAVVSDQAFADVGAALTLDRMRFSVDFTTPLTVQGESGTVGGYTVTAPSVDPASHPDTLSDVRLGFDARILGGPHGAFRLGAGAVLIVPNGNTADFDTDGTFRGMLRLHVAGDLGPFAYAAHVGVHLRPRDPTGAPGSPLGDELLFGVAAGVRLPVGSAGAMALIVGPEVFGASALQSLFGGTSTAVEGLLGARLEGTGHHGLQLRFKAGIGAGLDAHFGAPDWRAVIGLEVFNHDVGH